MFFIWVSVSFHPYTHSCSMVICFSTILPRFLPTEYTPLLLSSNSPVLVFSSSCNSSTIACFLKIFLNYLNSLPRPILPIIDLCCFSLSSSFSSTMAFWIVSYSFIILLFSWFKSFSDLFQLKVISDSSLLMISRHAAEMCILNQEFQVYYLRTC